MYLAMKPLWQQLTLPSNTISDPARRRQSQLLRAIILFLIGGLLVFYLAPGLMGIYPLTTLDIVINGLGCAAWIYGYRLSYRGQYEQAAMIVCTSLSATVLAMTFGIPYLRDAWMLYYLLIPVFLSSIFLSSWVTLMLATFNLVVTSILTELTPGITQDDLPFIFPLMLTAIIILLKRHQYLLEQDRKLALEKSENRYRTLYHTITDGIAVMAGDGVILEANPAFRRLFQVRQPVNMLLDDFINLSPMTTAQPVLFNDGPTTSSITGIRADNTTFDAEIYVRPIKYEDMNLYVSVIRDVTYRKLAQEQEIALKLEQEKVTIMRQFVNDASHDLRTPISVIYTSLHLLQKAPTLEKRIRHIKALETQARQLNEMVDNLLNIARLDRAAEQKFEYTPTSIADLMRDCVEEQRIYASNKNITLKSSLDNQNLIVMAEADELKRALRQLLTNAMHYTPEGGKANIYTQQEDNQVIIAVSDTGIGISPEDQQNIFQMFYRADPARAAQQGGMGIGLALCKQVVEAHGGSISVESTPGQGSTFRITLPLASAHDLQKQDVP